MPGAMMGLPGMSAYPVPPAQPEQPVALFVFHLPNETTEDELSKLFSLYGDVVKVNIPKDKNTNQPKGYGFVHMANAKDAETAIQFLNGHKLGNKFLKVSIKSGSKGSAPDQPVSVYQSMAAAAVGGGAAAASQYYGIPGYGV